MAALHDEIPEIVLTWHERAQTDTINLKETIFLMTDKDDTVKYE